jgi:hypothetical protein
MLPPQNAIPVENGLSFHGGTPVWRPDSQSRAAVTLTLAGCEFYSTGKCQRPLKKAIGVPEIAGSEASLELTGRMRDNIVSGVPWRRQLMSKQSECWHSVYSVGLTGGHISVREG